MKNVHPDDFLDRLATCPLCQRSNIRLRAYAGSVVFDEHAMNDVISTHPSPYDPRARVDPQKLGAMYAHVRCALSLARLMTMEDR